MSTATHPVEEARSTRSSLDAELALFVLEKCRELVEEYSTLARWAPEAFPFGEQDLLRWYADMKLKVCGASCSICGAQVRHPVPVEAEIDASTSLLYACLCPGCFAAHQADGERLSLELSGTRLSQRETIRTAASASAA